jgi:hypothetical protein
MFLKENFLNNFAYPLHRTVCNMSNCLSAQCLSNLKSKNVLNSFSQSSLATLTYYLPFRAKTLHNFMSELNLEREEGMYHRESTRSYIKTAEITVCEYIHNLQSSSLFALQKC